MNATVKIDDYFRSDKNRCCEKVGTINEHNERVIYAIGNMTLSANRKDFDFHIRGPNVHFDFGESLSDAITMWLDLARKEIVPSLPSEQQQQKQSLDNPRVY